MWFMLGALGCGESAKDSQPPDSPGLTETGDTATQAPDPFVALPDRSGGLTNVSEDLDTILEHGALDGACDAWRAQPDDAQKRLLCGKWMFFYETFGTEEVPRALVDFVLDGFVEDVGPAFSSYGLIPDPSSEHGYPLGMALGPGEEGLAFTCASCHFARLPDGRYAVGAANHQYDYGTHNLSMALLPLAAMESVTGAEVDELARADIQPLLDRLAADSSLQISFLGLLFSLLGKEAPTFSAESQRHYAEWLPGTQDFMIEPLPVNDEVHTVSKISALYGLPTEEEAAAAGMAHAMLGWTGNTRSLAGFVRLFDQLGGGDGPNFSDDQLAPRVDYISSLSVPSPPPADAEAVARGAAVFVDAGCLGCHEGPGGSGLTLYDYAEIGTDDALARWMDADGDGEPCCEADLGEDTLTGQLKSPRLWGLWAMERFLHNGAVGSLEELVCLDGPRTPITTPAMSNDGHLYGCDTLSDEEKRDLLVYLRAH